MGGNSSDIIYDLYLEKQEANKHEKNKKGSNGHIQYLHNYAISITFKRSSLEPHSELIYFQEFSAHIRRHRL